MITPEIHTVPVPPAVPARGPLLRRLRAFAVPAQLALVICLLSGVPVPGAAVLGGKLLLLVTLGAEARMWLLLRRHGLSRRDALTHLVPGTVLGFFTHELRLMVSLVRWIGRRRHGVEGAEAVFPHGRDQAALMYGFAFVCVVETVVLSFLLAGWPVTHAVMLVVDVYTVLFVLGIHAASVTRPHVLADGVLRVRQGAHVDVLVPLDRIASVRRETLFTHEKKVGELNLAVGSQTSLTLHLTEPVDAPRFLGAPRQVTVIRMHADDPKFLYDAVTRAHAALPA
ncbi:hypothetical protein [Streptomyces adustus]|uniref:hypothetical protein n=1 Tax=Streptomyces adustus TaxID=1609272 RepID=UPI00371EDDCD